ncbi:hypothetical protein ACNA06_21985 [Lysinibacillus sp. RSDA_15]|nr:MULTISPECIES: hypothetical protein [Lysinibacillus]MBG9755062.1 hypothetical protein [Lysinibacillus sphaericus]MBI6863677.1 hypothetical protein [Lysinibacillus fusiformis]MDM5349924.1 hypothetical protein [Lysinibacillus sphaericus]MEB7454735.1 hypothetical protein [Lysinibacillus sphaericus]QIC45770.1 hypothetical protein GAG94_00640 [Lysinibacillus sphaericus]
MDRFELTFKNKAVRIWFYTVFPAIILAIISIIILPNEQHKYVSLGLSLMPILYFIWFIFYTKKKRK